MRANLSKSRAYSPHGSRSARQKHKLLKRYRRVASIFAAEPTTPAQVADKLKLPALEVRMIVRELLDAGILAVSYIRPEGIYFTQTQ